MEEIKKVTEPQELHYTIIMLTAVGDINILDKLTQPINAAIREVCSERNCVLDTCEFENNTVSIKLQIPIKHDISFLVALLKQRSTGRCWNYDYKLMRTVYCGGKYILWNNRYHVKLPL